MTAYFGIIQRGHGAATKLGIPTINIPLEDSSISGIFAAVVKVGDASYNAAAYADTRRKLLEAHLLDITEDLYGKEATIELKKKIREDKQFDDESALQAAITEDIRAIESYFKSL